MGAKLASLSGVTGATQDRGLSFITSTTFSAVSTLSLDNVFSSTFTNYRIIAQGTASVYAGLYMRMRVAGADDSTASSYVKAAHYTHSTGDAVDRGTTTYWQLNGWSSTWENGIVADLMGPALAKHTMITYSSSGSNSADYTSYYGGARHNVATAYDGFTIYPSTGTFTGSVSVYGYRS